MEKIKTREDILKLLTYRKDINAYELRLEGSCLIDAKVVKNGPKLDSQFVSIFLGEIDNLEKLVKSKIEKTRCNLRLVKYDMEMEEAKTKK